MSDAVTTNVTTEGVDPDKTPVATPVLEPPRDVVLRNVDGSIAIVTVPGTPMTWEVGNQKYKHVGVWGGQNGQDTHFYDAVPTT